MPTVESILQALSAGVLIGCMYGLMCVALGLIFGVMRLVNFAQGDFLMLGMYFAVFVTGAGLEKVAGPVVAVLLAGVLALVPFFILGWLVHQVFVGPVSGMEKSLLEEERHQAQLIMTLGISLVLANGGLMVFGSTPMTMKTPLSSEAWQFSPFFGEDILIFLNKAQVLTAGVAVLAAAGLYALLHATNLGKRLRAAADNPTAAIYMGIDVARSHRVAFGLGIGLTGVAGVMTATFYPFQPYTGLDFIVIMYAGVVLGGLGSVMGSFWGGLIIGLVQQLSTLGLPVQLQGTAVFVVFLLTMLVRPQGLFGRNVERA